MQGNKIIVKRLNLGSGGDYKKGWVNLDYNRDYNVDIVHNINKFPWPFKNEEFDYIYCSHILEHVEDFFKTLEEILRITKKGGIIRIRVPHFSNGNGYNDLTHKRFFGWFTFDQIENGYYNNKFNFKRIYQKYNFAAGNRKVLNFLFSWIFNMMPKGIYERFLCWIIPVGEIEIKLKKFS